MAAYSFLNVVAAIAGPGGVINLGAGAGVAEEGISIEPVEDKNAMTIGADGTGQHALIASDAGVVTLRFLKTSPTNAALQLMYDLQSANSSLWGINTITVVDTARGDLNTCQQCAFKKKPAVDYPKDPKFMEWTFDSVVVTTILGPGFV